MLRHPLAAFSEIRLVRTLARNVPEFGNEPWFEKADVVMVAALLDCSRSVVEYGAGSSTMFFASRSSLVVSVDSCESYVSAVRAETARRKISNSHVIFADIGPTREWGWPIDHYPTARNLEKWKLYMKAPWKNMDDSCVGLVVIDGRFRVACAAYAIARLLERGESDANIFLDDYVGRENYYDSLREIADLVATPGRGMLVKPRDVSVEKADAFAERAVLDIR